MGVAVGGCWRWVVARGGEQQEGPINRAPGRVWTGRAVPILCRKQAVSSRRGEAASAKGRLPALSPSQSHLCTGPARGSGALQAQCSMGRCTSRGRTRRASGYRGTGRMWWRAQRAAPQFQALSGAARWATPRGYPPTPRPSPLPEKGGVSRAGVGAPARGDTVRHTVAAAFTKRTGWGSVEVHGSQPARFCTKRIRVSVEEPMRAAGLS